MNAQRVEVLITSIKMDIDDYITKLEKAAIDFLNLLKMHKHFRAYLPSISIVCQVAQFILYHTELAQSSVRSNAGKLNQVTSQVDEAVFNKKASSVKRKREPVTGETTSILTRSKTKRTQSNTKLLKIKKMKIVKHDDIKKNPVMQVEAQNESSNNSNEQHLQTQNSNEHPNLKEVFEEIDDSEVPLFPQSSQFSDWQCSYCYKLFIDRRNLKSHMWVHERDKTFKCEVCQKLFLRSHQLTRHKRVHTGEKPYSCVICEKAFADVSNLNTHKWKKHPNQVTLLLRCEKCGKECRTRRELKAHLAEHQEKLEEETNFIANDAIGLQGMRHMSKVSAAKKKGHGDSEAFLCQICGKSLNKQAALLAHMKRHIRKKDFCCEFCNKVFPELHELKMHRKEHDGERPYKCDKCGKGFKSQGTLRSHLGVHSGEQPYGCDVCGKTFSQTSGLNHHKLKHTAEEERLLGKNNTDNQHHCDICGRCYKTKFRLQLHLRSHDSKRDVSCDFCEKKFQTTQDLATHRRSHTKDKYSCRICGISFKSRSLYYFHTKTHQIDRPFLCSTCSKSFISVNDLNAHTRRHTMGNVFRRPQEQFICNICGRVYQMKNSLTIHMKIHQGIFDHPCDFCDKKFKSPAELRHHRRVHTQEKPYICETCNHRFSRHSTLVNHRRTHSGERPYMCTVCGATFKLSCTFKKHAKIHSKEPHKGKGRNKPKNQEPTRSPNTQDHQHHSEQIQHHQQLLPPFLPPPLSLSGAHLLPNAVDSEQTHLIHELKPRNTNLKDSTSILYERANILLNPNLSLIQQPMSESGLIAIEDGETDRNLIEMRNALPNSGTNNFAPYYYY